MVKAGVYGHVGRGWYVGGSYLWDYDPPTVLDGAWTDPDVTGVYNKYGDLIGWTRPGVHYEYGELDRSAWFIGFQKGQW
jgi:hypothetical protein